MKTRTLTRSIQAFLLAAAFAAPMAFAQDSTPAPMQDSTPPPAQSETPPPSTANSSVMSNDKAMPAEKQMSWKQLDTNKDGKLSKDEVAGDPQWTADFDTADTNKDGYLSKAEFKSHKAEMKKMAKT